MRYTPLTAADFATIDGLDDWRYLLGAIHAEFRAGSYLAAAELVRSIAALAEAEDHHPEIDVRWPDRVHVALTTHAVDGLSDVDVDVARTISVLALQAGATGEPLTPQVLEVGIDTMDAASIRPFWAAVMGYRDQKGTLVDPLGRGPAIWFQEMIEPRPQRNRVHLDITVAHDAAESRVAAAIAAGGTLVSAEFARSWWILADADGNEVCVCTWQDRS
jgi:4a-hydroxytetrahydrobiopterin dehydratase